MTKCISISYMDPRGFALFGLVSYLYVDIYVYIHNDIVWTPASWGLPPASACLLGRDPKTPRWLLRSHPESHLEATSFQQMRHLNPTAMKIQWYNNVISITIYTCRIKNIHIKYNRVKQRRMLLPRANERMSPKKGPFRNDNSLPLPRSIFQGTLARFRGVTSFEKAA